MYISIFVILFLALLPVDDYVNLQDKEILNITGMKLLMNVL